MATINNEDILRALLELGGGLNNEIKALRAEVRDAVEARQGRSELERRLDGAAMLARELQELSQHITDTRLEIARLVGKAPAPGGQAGKITSAHDELDAIVQSTEIATNNIMDGAERIQNNVDAVRADLGGKESPALDQISDEVIRIFEHCNFQDLTGQRISKVVKTLTYIDTRIGNMIKIWGEADESELATVPAADEAQADPEQALLNGPQLPEKAASQSEIDQLFP